MIHLRSLAEAIRQSQRTMSIEVELNATKRHDYERRSEVDFG